MITKTQMLFSNIRSKLRLIRKKSIHVHLSKYDPQNKLKGNDSTC